MLKQDVIIKLWYGSADFVEIHSHSAQVMPIEFVLDFTWLSQSQEAALEVEVYEVCNEVTPDILWGLCCIGLQGVSICQGPPVANLPHAY